MTAKYGYIGYGPDTSPIVVAKQVFSPTGVQTNFTFAAGYQIGYIDLYLNGAKQIEGQDFNATDTSTVSLISPAQSGDVVELVAYKAYNLAAPSSVGNFTVGGNLTVTGNETVTTLAATSSVGIGTTFTVFSTPPYQLTVTAPGAIPTPALSYCVADFTNNINGYSQVNIRNANTSFNASGDLVITTDNGTDTTNFIDLGINNTGFNTSTWTVNGALDGYLYSSNTNFSIGVGLPNRYLSFFTGGTLAANERMRITDTGVSIGSTTTTGTASQPLQVTGGAYFSGVGTTPGSIGVGITLPQGGIDIRTSPQWSTFNYGANLILGGSRNNGLGILDFSNSNPWAIVNGSGTLVIAAMPSLGDTTSAANSGIFNIQRNGNILIGTGSSTGTASQPLQVTGGAYVSGNVGVGTTNPTSTLQITGGDSRFGGVIETVSTATTYTSTSGALVVEMDVRRATTYTYTIPTNANIGIVSFRNMPAQTNNPSGTTITLIATQNAAGSANTTAGTGIGTNITVNGYENGVAVAGISTRALVSAGSTITLSTSGSDRDFISFFINYTGGTNTSAASYQVYATRNGGFR
jgi:hypothetical protein